MTTQTPGVSLPWRLLDEAFQITLRDCRDTTAQPCQAATQPLFMLCDGGDTAVVSIDPALISPSNGSTSGELWRGLSLDHQGVSLPARVLARLCTAMDAAAVPIVLASLPGKTLLLFPNSLAGRALAALHQAGSDRITF